MPPEREQKNFDKKHGKGSYERMKTLLADPRNSYAYVAEKGGWYDVLYPSNVKGHERQKLRILFLFDDKSGNYPMLSAKQVCKSLHL